MLRRRRSFARLFALLSCGLFLSYGAFWANAVTAPVNVLLGWQDSSMVETGFAVERALTPKGPWVLAGTAPANEPSFLDVNLKPAKAYYYRVRAFNNLGASDYSNVARVVTPFRAMPPRIKSHPIRQTVILGGDVMFSAVAAGNPPLRYQWRCNGTNLPGANLPVLNLKSVRATQIGNYSLVVSNDVGAVASLAAKLTMLAPLAWSAEPGGTIWPYASGKPLEIGRVYTVVAMPRSGNVFSGWRTNGEPAQAGRALRFTMQPGLELEAGFRDVAVPTLSVLNPRTGSRVNTAQVSLRGTARDNMAVSEIWYQLNDNPWLPAVGTTNWQAQLSLNPGLNFVRTFARDTTGNNSRTNTLTITSLATNPVVVQPQMITGNSPTANSVTLPMLSAGSTPQPVLADIRVVEGTATISLFGVTGALYQLEYKESLNDPAWTPLISSLARGSNGDLQLLDMSATQSHRFYRVRAGTSQ